MTSFFTDEKNILAVSSIIAIITLFSVYYYLAERKVLMRFVRRRNPAHLSQHTLEFISEKITGILLTGVAPLLLFLSVMRHGAAASGSPASEIKNLQFLICILPPVAIILSFFSSKNRKLWKESPQLREKNWNIRHLFLSAVLWIIYILGYEFFFRGVLWFTCYEAFGFPVSLAINIILYSVVHIPKGVFLVIGSVPFGIIVCCTSYLSGSFLPAFLIHASMAVTTEISAEYHNPEFRFSLKGQYI